MTLRIIGGKFRNRELKTPKGPQTRPTLAVLRKAVFDICQQEIAEASFLDLFAGSGAMGIEALSRGAAHATFVDQDRYALRSIHDNLKTLQIETQATVIATDGLVALNQFVRQKVQFDIIYIDPPYAAAKGKLLCTLLDFIDANPLLKAGGILFIEEAVPAQIKEGELSLQNLKFINSRTFSQSVLHQFYTALGLKLGF